MGKSNTPDPPNYQKYGVPFYSVAWAPNVHKPKEDDTDTQSLPDRNHVVLAGGGGEGRSGIPNAILLALFDPASNSLSPHPVARLATASDLPYRMAVHPAAHGLLCAFTHSCRWFEWEEEKSGEAHKLGVKVSEKVLTQLQDVGQQLALTFSKEGSMLAVGGEDGKLRVFKWPSMEIILDDDKAHSTIKQLDFSPDGKFLVSLGTGPCRVWDVTSSTTVASLPKEKDEAFCGCRFSLINDGNHILYIAASTGKRGSIVTWNTTTWKKIGSKPIVRDNITAFDVSADGKFIACGTTQGDIVIVNSTRLQIHKVVKKAHLGFVTALSFSHDSRALASASLDSSARVSTVEDEKKNGGWSLWVIMLIILVAIAAYFLNDHPEKLVSFYSQLEKIYRSWRRH